MKLYPIFKRLKSKKKKFIFNSDRVKITRASASLSPMQCYNLTSANVFSNDQLITIDNAFSKMFFVGGDTTSINYDFLTKVAGSIAECPMKIYKQEVDLANLPSPSVGWIEITNQSYIDKLKQQNELPITSTNTTDRTAVYNGQTLIQQSDSHPAIRDDFVGKKSGSTIENPNIEKRGAYTSLVNPSTFNYEEPAYLPISILDNATQTISTSINGQIPEILFSFNIVEMVIRKYGNAIGTTLAEQIAWCKANISKIVCNWWGYGSGFSGNKAYLSRWCIGLNNWDTGSNVSNTASTPQLLSLIQNTQSAIANTIDSNGYAHFIAYTDASNGVTPSIVYTDYIDIDVQFKAPFGYDVLVPSNSRRDSVTAPNYDNVVLLEKIWNPITTDFAGKVAGSTVENGNIAKTIASGYGTFIKTPTDSNWSEVIQSVYGYINTLNASNATSSRSVNGDIAQQLFSFDLVKAFEKVNGTIGASDKVAWIKGVLSSLIYSWYGYGSCPSGSKAYLDFWNGLTWHRINSGSYKTNTSSSPTILTEQNGSWIVDSSGFVYFIAYTDASNGTIESVINTDYVKLDMTFKNGNNALEFFTNNSIEIEVTTVNKASALMVECDLTQLCNILYGGSNAAMKAALKAISADIWAQGSGASGGVLTNGFTTKLWNGNWVNTTGYSNPAIQKITNTKIGNDYTDINNKIYILIASQNASDTIIPSQVALDYLNIKIDIARTPDTVSPIQVNLPKYWAMIIKGVSNSYDSTLIDKIRRYMTLYKDDNNRISLLWETPGKFKFNGKANGITVSVESNTEVFNKYQVYNFILEQINGNKVLYVLKNNSTIEKYVLQDSNLITGLYSLYLMQYLGTQQADAFMESCTLIDLTNKPSGFTDNEALAILNGTAQGYENPELFDINAVTLNANASRSNGVITLNATEGFQASTLAIPVLPNNRYKLKINITGFIDTNKKPYVNISEKYNNILIKNDYIYPMSDPSNATLEFTTDSKVNNIVIYLTNNAAGTFTFSNISLKRKD